jgi:hypothetical protein
MGVEVVVPEVEIQAEPEALVVADEVVKMALLRVVKPYRELIIQVVVAEVPLKRRALAMQPVMVAQEF